MLPIVTVITLFSYWHLEEFQISTRHSKILRWWALLFRVALLTVNSKFGTNSLHLPISCSKSRSTCNQWSDWNPSNIVNILWPPLTLRKKHIGYWNYWMFLPGLQLTTWPKLAFRAAATVSVGICRMSRMKRTTRRWAWLKAENVSTLYKWLFYW